MGYVAYVVLHGVPVLVTPGGGGLFYATLQKQNYRPLIWLNACTETGLRGGYPS